MKRIFSTLALGLLGLAGSAVAAPQLSPQGIIVNPVPTDLQVRTWVNKDPNKSGNPVYQIGERISVSVQVNQDAYVYIFSVKSTGEIGLILPNQFDQNNLLRAGESRTFPPASGARYTLDVAGPEGQDRVLAVATRSPLSLNQIADIQTGDVRVQGADNLARALSIVVTPLPERDWVSNVAFFTVGRLQPQPPATGSLAVNSNPQGAQVFVDGNAVGNTPLSVQLRPGRANVELRLGGYETFRTSVVIRPGETARVNADLVQVVRNGLIQVNSNVQGAQVLLNGRAAGNAPVNLSVQPGVYEVEVRAGGYQTFRQRVSVGNGQTVAVNANLAQLQSRLEIFTNTEARIFVNGREVGRTDGNFFRLEDVDAGRYQVVAIAQGFRVAFADVTVNPGQTPQVRLNLERAR